MIIHDNLGSGIVAYNEAEGHIFNGCLVYNNGFNTTHNEHPLYHHPAHEPLYGGNFRPGGHGLYLQNNHSGSRRIVRDNIIFHNASTGMKTYMSTTGNMYNYDIDQNISVNNGAVFIQYHNYYNNPGTQLMRWGNDNSMNFFVSGADAFNYNLRKNHFINSDLTYPMTTPSVSQMITGPTSTYLVQTNILIGEQFNKQHTNFVIKDNYIIGGGNYAASPWNGGAFSMVSPENITFEDNTILWGNTNAIFLYNTHAVINCPRINPNKPFDDIASWDRTRYIYSPASCTSSTCNIFKIHTYSPGACSYSGNVYNSLQDYFWTYNQWKTTFTDIDQSSTIGSYPSSDDVVYIQNSFDPGRLHIQGYDWNSSSDVQINLNGKVPSGRAFTIRNAQDPANNLVGVPSSYSTPFYVPCSSAVAQPNGAALTGNPNYMVTAMTTGPRYATYIVDFFPYTVSIGTDGMNTCNLLVEFRDNSNNLVDRNAPEVRTWFRTLKYTWSKQGDPAFCNSASCNSPTITADGAGTYQVTITTPDCKSITVTQSIPGCYVLMQIKKPEEEMQNNSVVGEQAIETPSKDVITISELDYMQASPNPFEIGVNIRYELNTAGNLKIEITDAAGKTIESVVNKRHEAGKFEVRALDKKDLPPGIYLVIVNFEGKIMRQKLIKQ